MFIWLNFDLFPLLPCYRNNIVLEEWKYLSRNSKGNGKSRIAVWTSRDIWWMEDDPGPCSEERTPPSPVRRQLWTITSAKSRGFHASSCSDLSELPSPARFLKGEPCRVLVSSIQDRKDLSQALSFLCRMSAMRITTLQWQKCGPRPPPESPGVVQQSHVAMGVALLSTLHLRLSLNAQLLAVLLSSPVTWCAPFFGFARPRPSRTQTTWHRNSSPLSESTSVSV